MIYEELLTNNRNPNDRTLHLAVLYIYEKFRRMLAWPTNELIGLTPSDISSHVVAYWCKYSCYHGAHSGNGSEHIRRLFEQPVVQDTPLLSVNILRVCKQIHSEAHKIIYEKNEFIFPYKQELPHLPLVFPREKLNFIRRLRIEVQLRHGYNHGFDFRGSILEKLRELVNLMYLQIIVTFEAGPPTIDAP